MLTDIKTGQSRITPSEFNRLRQMAAKNGYVITEAELNNPETEMRAWLKAMPPEYLAEYIEFCETGSCPLSRGESDLNPSELRLFDR